MKQPMEVVTERGGKFIVDISDEACAEFGVRHGDKIIPNGCQGCSAYDLSSPLFVIGVTPRSKSDCNCSNCQASSKNTLWVSKGEGSAEITYFFESADDFYKVV